MATRKPAAQAAAQAAGPPKTPAKKAASKTKTPEKKTPAKPGGRPRKLSDDELLEAALSEPSPSRIAARLGVHRNTVTARLRDPAVQEALADHRRRSLELASTALAERAADAVQVLVDLMEESGPQDSVRLGAASLVLRTIQSLAKTERSEEAPDDVWEKPPAFVPRLVQGGRADEETDE